MRILMVSPYPPVRDGIAAYAVQMVAALRAQGHDVEVLSPGPSAAHHHLDLVGPRGALALAKRVRGYDKVIIQFHPDVFYAVPSTPAQHAAESAALYAAVRLAREVEFWVHEIDYRYGRSRGIDGIAARRLWRAAHRIVTHTEVEREDFVAAFGVSPERVRVAPHGGAFVRHTALDRRQARASLGLGAETVFLAIGFIQPHKGFDRAVRAFAGLAEHGARLELAGSVRVEETEYVNYLSQLRELVTATPGVELHEGYLSDERFDRWLLASDVVVLPYRHIWSSGILERAALFDRRVIATAVGGLTQQAANRPGVTLVADDAALRTAMWSAAGVDPSGALDASPWPSAGPDLQARVQAEVVRRAALHRTPADPAAPGPPVTGPPGTAASEPVRRLPPYALPSPTSARPFASTGKRVIGRLVDWQLRPLAHQVNALRQATIEALDTLGSDHRGQPPSASS